jgi:hypothetical protein
LVERRRPLECFDMVDTTPIDDGAKYDAGSGPVVRLRDAKRR